MPPSRSGMWSSSSSVGKIRFGWIETRAEIRSSHAAVSSRLAFRSRDARAPAIGQSSLSGSTWGEFTERRGRADGVGVNYAQSEHQCKHRTELGKTKPDRTLLNRANRSSASRWRLPERVFLVIAH